MEIKGTTNQDEFYQEMMGLYVIYQDYPHLDFTKITEVKHDLAKHKFPVYTHNMYNGSKSAFLYYFYNTEPQLDEQECPEGCWILSSKKLIYRRPLKMPYFPTIFSVRNDPRQPLVWKEMVLHQKSRW